MEKNNNVWNRFLSVFKTAKTEIDGVSSSQYMSPNQPMKPVETGADKSQARTRDYRVGENLEKSPKLTKFEQLRQLAEFCTIVRTVIQKRKGQISQLKYKFVINEKNNLIEDNPEVEKIKQFFKKPDGRNNFDVWLNMIIEDLLVLDAPTLNVVRTLGGDIHKLRVVDGATIKPLINEWGEIPDDGINPAYQQEIKGTVFNNFTSDELIYRPMNVRSHKLYGFSPVEQIQRTINLLLRKENDQLNYFVEGNLPHTLIGTPADWTPEQILEFQNYWDEMNIGVDKRKAKAIPGSTTIYNTKPEPLKDEFDDWLARLVCAAFSISPSAFIKDNNRATAETQKETAKEEGLEVLKEWIRNFINEILNDHFKTKVEFQWAIDDEKDPVEVANIIQIYVGLGVKTINEARAELGLKPLKGGDEIRSLTAPKKEPDSEEDEEDKPTEKFYKKKSGKVDINDLEIVQEAQKKLEDILNEYFASQKEAVLQYVSKLKLSKSADIEDEINLEGEESFIKKVVDSVKEYLLIIAIVSYKYTLNYIGKAKQITQTGHELVFHNNEGILLDKPIITLPEAEKIIAIQAEKKAMEYAGRRSAELIGKKILKDGSIVDNPKAKYAISDTTRTGIEGLIEQAVDGGWSNQQLASEIEEAYLFSAERSTMVARTETNLANNNISVDTYTSAGIQKKRWLTAHDDRVDPCCTENEKQGAIDINAKFSSGSIAPPAHPNCRCTILAVFEDED